jgi:hypothetical protein
VISDWWNQTISNQKKEFEEFKELQEFKEAIVRQKIGLGRTFCLQSLFASELASLHQSPITSDCLRSRLTVFDACYPRRAQAR